MSSGFSHFSFCSSVVMCSMTNLNMPKCSPTLDSPRKYAMIGGNCMLTTRLLSN